MCKMYNRLKELCDAKGVSGYRMCKDTGLQPSTMTDLKKGRKKTLSAKSVSILADYFGVSMNYILGDVEEPVALSDGDKGYLSSVKEGTVTSHVSSDKDALQITAEDFSDLAVVWNALKDRPEAKVLFKSANTATAEQLLETIKFLDYLKSKG